jgi:hypothetical protein
VHEDVCDIGNILEKSEGSCQIAFSWIVDGESQKHQVNCETNSNSLW